MLLRVLSAAIGIPLFLAITIWGEVPFAISVFILALIGLVEMVKTYRSIGFRVNPLFAGAGLLAVAWPLIISFHVGAIRNAWIDPLERLVAIQNGITLALPVVLLLAPIWEVVTGARTGEMQAGRRLGYGAVCGLYISLFAGLIWLRMWMAYVPVYEFPGRYNAGLLLLTVFCVWAADSFAFFGGKAFGHHKLAPKLSPGKTVEGLLAGLASALIVGVAFGIWFFDSARLGLLIGAVAGIFGPAGDLFESALKREAGVKDFGGILPGHGGVLDRFDSLLFVAPIVALLCPYLPALR